VVINHFWGFGEEVYPYSRVRAVVRVTHVRNVFGIVMRRDRPVLTLVFDDGRTWTAEFGQGSAEVSDERKVIELMWEKLGLRPVTAQFPEDVNP
jgi:hypothetical protein